MTSDLDLSACWARTMHMLNSNAQLLGTIAGVFVTLPFLTLMVVLADDPSLVAMSSTSNIAEFQTALEAFQSRYYLVFLLVGAITSAGILSVQALMLDRSQATVGTVIARAAKLLPSYMLASLVVTLAAQLGLYLLIIPGLYIAIRTLLIGPVAVAERQYNPLTLISRAWQIVAGNVWRVFLFMLIIILVMLVSMIVIWLVTAVLIGLSGDSGLIGLLGQAIIAVSVTLIWVVIAACQCAVYRELTPNAEVSAAFD